MGLLGTAIMAAWLEVSPDATSEFDDWHTHEHMPERLAIPGFLRGTRWLATSGRPSYFVCYEVEAFDTLTSEPYLERLNNPTPWTQKIMGSVRTTARSLCRVSGSFGTGVGAILLSIRLSPTSGAEDALRAWLTQTALPGLPVQPGLIGTHLLESGKQSERSQPQGEERRGGDAQADWALLAEGYSLERVMSLSKDVFREDVLVAHGAMRKQVAEVYRLACTLTSQDLQRNG